MSTYGPISAPQLDTEQEAGNQQTEQPVAGKNTFPKNISFMHVSATRDVFVYLCV